MPRKSFPLATGQRMEYEILSPTPLDPKKPTPFIVSVSGRDQFHVNGFTQRLLSENWCIAMAIRPPTAPLFFEGSGAQGDGCWHLHQLCQHLLKEYSICGNRFLLVGVSNGGNSVLRFATLWPELVCGVVVATGSLNGLVELPAGAKKLSGIPVDMYVGTKDECGFYKPMVELRDHFKSVGHKPVAELTIFQDAGHICSPLIDDFSVHSKMGFMFLHAGALKSSALSGPLKASRPSEKIMASLTAFAKELGLSCRRAHDGGLQVEKVGGTVGGLLVTMMLPKQLPALALQAPPDPSRYKVNEPIEVWSNSRQRWDAGKVVRVNEVGEEGGVQVIFEDERGQVSKTIPWALVKNYIRAPSENKSIVPTLAGFSVGDMVAVWSSSQKKWMLDGSITAISRENGISVAYCDGSLAKTIPLENVAEFLRRPASHMDESSPQCQPKLVTGPSKPLLAAPTPGTPRAASPRGSPSQAPIARQQSWAVTPKDAAGAPSPVANQSQPRHTVVVATGKPAAAPPTPSIPATTGFGMGQALTPTAAVTVTTHAAGSPSPTASPAAAASPFGGATPSNAGAPVSPRPAQAATPTGLAAAYAPGTRVTIWSASNGKWFDDGTVEKVGDEGITVIYAGGSMSKLVLMDHASQFLRRVVH